MKKLTIKKYSFEELPKDIQEKVIEKNREINIDYYWSECTEWNIQDMLKERGYKDPKILYSGFCSQGDGACFEATIDIPEWLKAHKLGRKYRALYNESQEQGVSMCLKHSGHYYHSLMTSLDYDGVMYMSDKAQKQFDVIYEMILQEREELGDKIYRELENEYEYKTMDEAVKETLIINDYQFTIDGSQSVLI